MNNYVVNFFATSINYTDLIKEQSLAPTSQSSKDGANFAQRAKKRGK